MNYSHGIILKIRGIPKWNTTVTKKSPFIHYSSLRKPHKSFPTVVVPLYLAIIGKSADAIHSAGNGMVFWLLESSGNCTKDQSQSISMKFSGPLLDITTGMSYKIVHET